MPQSLFIYPIELLDRVINSMRLLGLFGLSKARPEPRPLPNLPRLVEGKQYQIRDYGNPKYAGLIVVLDHFTKEGTPIVRPLKGQKVDHDFGIPAGNLLSVPITGEERNIQ